MFNDFLASATSALIRTHTQHRTAREAEAAWTDEVDERVMTIGDARVAVSLNSGEGVSRLVFRVVEGRLEHASLGLRVAYGQWSRGVEVTMPAAVYAGNRHKPLGTWASEELEDRGPDPEVYQTPVVPALRVEGGGTIAQLAGDMSVPLVAVFDPGSRRAMLIATPQRATGVTQDTAIRLIEADDASTAAVEVLAAGVRQVDKRPGRPSRDTGANVAVGDVVTLTLLHEVFDCDTPAALHRRLMHLRPRLAFTRVASQTPLQPREVLPFSTTFAVQERKFNEQNWVEKYGYYSVGMREVPSQDWQTGWVGGPNALYPLLAEGDAITRRRAARTFDFLRTAVSPSGFVYGRFSEGTWADTRRLYLRYQADSLYFLAKSLLLMRHRGDTIGEGWLDLPRGIADAFVTMWDRDGQLGQYADANTGEILIGRTCAAGLAPAGLLIAAELLDEPRYAQAAADIGGYYHERFTRRAFTNGGPGDISQAHDSESAFALLASYAHLLEATGDPRWADAARDAAAQAASYVMTYDFDFPATSTFGRLGMRTRGTVFANVQNKHSAPGICTLSGVSLLRLARATGERRWLDLLADIAGAIPQYMSRADRPIRDVRLDQRWPIMPEGWINERINTSDWEVIGDPPREIGVGEIFGGPTWSEAAMLLTRAQLPGVYIHRDRGWCVALDHVRASVDGDTLTLENPTRFDARVKLLVEDDDTSATPLSFNTMTDERGVQVPPHTTITLNLYSSSL